MRTASPAPLKPEFVIRRYAIVKAKDQDRLPFFHRRLGRIKDQQFLGLRVSVRQYRLSLAKETQVGMGATEVQTPHPAAVIRSGLDAVVQHGQSLDSRWQTLQELRAARAAPSRLECETPHLRLR